MNEINKYLALMERKKKRLIRTILGGDAKRCASPPTKVLNYKMISKRKDLNYEQCLELKMTKTAYVCFDLQVGWNKFTKKLSEAVSEHPTFMTIGMCRGYGKIVSVLAFHSNDPSLNLAEFYSVYLDIV